MTPNRNLSGIGSFSCAALATITGFGQDGPYAHRAGYDYIIQGMSGLMSLTGHPDGEPLRAGVAITDIFTGVYSVVIVLGSIYGGFATPTEAGAVGTVGAVLISGIYRRLSWSLLREALSRTASMSGNILFIVFTSMIFAYATALSGIGEDLVAMLEDANVSRLTFLLIIMVVFAILGCFMEGLGMIAIIVPVIFPALIALDVDPIWFGVFVVILVELGQLTPPLGVILFVVASSSSEVKVEDVIMGTLPFFIIIVAFMLLLIAAPQIALFLPEFTFG